MTRPAFTRQSVNEALLAMADEVHRRNAAGSNCCGRRQVCSTQYDWAEHSRKFLEWARSVGCRS
jgi:hypothetical protein